MSQSRPDATPPLFSSIDVSAEATPKSNQYGLGAAGELLVGLMQQMIANQQRQTKLLEELVQQASAAQRQRQQEIGAWREANPKLARACRRAAESLSEVQTRFLENLTEEVTDSSEALLDGEFMLNEFVDRYGPRLAHLNGVLQMLSQLSANPAPSNSNQ